MEIKLSCEEMQELLINSNLMSRGHIIVRISRPSGDIPSIKIYTVEVK